MRTLLIALLGATLPSASTADEVSTFGCATSQPTTRANVREVYAAYGVRSVAIVRSALAGDAATLSTMVSPTATFTIYEGDVGVSPRSQGTAAAIEFAKQISPRSFRFSAGSAGPISVDPCSSTTAELTFISDKPDEAVVATFKYQAGRLTEVLGSRVELTTGYF